MMRIEESLSFYRDNRMRFQSELTSSETTTAMAPANQASPSQGDVLESRE
jgi:hypothetical protein